MLILANVIWACSSPTGDVSTSTPLQEPTSTVIPSQGPTALLVEPSLTPSPEPTLALKIDRGVVRYSIPLHLQHKTQDRLDFMFQLNNAGQGKLYWWPEGESAQMAEWQNISADASPQLISITGLTPGQSYQVALAFPEADGYDRLPTYRNEVWDPISARTLQVEAMSLRFGVFGDSGFGEAITEELAAQLSEHDPDMVFHTGDLVYLAYQEGNPLAAYQTKWFATMSALVRNTAIYPVPGNHEYDGDVTRNGLPYYFEAFPMLAAIDGGWYSAPEGIRREWYALEFGSLQVLFLNSQQLYGGAARQEQDAWVTTRLEDERFTASIVVFHVPPFTSGRHPMDGAAIRSSWVPAFEASNVVLVISGHDHNYERLERNGITYIVSGGGSSVLYPLQDRRSESLKFEAVSHYALFEVSESRIDLQVFNLDGDTIDQAFIPLE